MIDPAMNDEDDSKDAVGELRRQRRNLFIVSAVLAVVQLGDISLKVLSPTQQLVPTLVLSDGRPFDIGRWVVWLMFAYTTWLFLVYIRRVKAFSQFFTAYKERMAVLFKKRFQDSIDEGHEINDLPMFNKDEEGWIYDRDWSIRKWRKQDRMVVMDIVRNADENTPPLPSAPAIPVSRDIGDGAFMSLNIRAIVNVLVYTHVLPEYIVPFLIAVAAVTIPFIVTTYCR